MRRGWRCGAKLLPTRLSSEGGGLRKLRFVDLFAGLGGFHAALARLGHECVLASEIDPELRQLYRLNFGILPEGDIRAIVPRQVPNFDLLCAGFPCQPFSKAGTQVGLNCERNGDLASVIIEWIRTYKPRYFILENVPNLERHDNGRTWRWLDRELRHAGYPFLQKRILSPHQYGIPQNRDRLFIVGAREAGTDFRWPAPSGCPTDIRTVLEPMGRGVPLSPKIEQAIKAWAEFVRLFPRGAGKPYFPIWAAEFGATYPYLIDPPMAVPGVARRCRGAFGKPIGTTAAALEEALPSYARGTTSFPGWKKTIIEQNRALYQEHRGWIDRWLPLLDGLERSYQKFEWNFGDGVEDVWGSIIQMRGSGIRAKSPTSAPALVASSTSQVPIIGWEKRYMTPRECARLQDLGELRALPATSAATTRALGNAVNAHVVELVARALVGAAPRLPLVVNG